MAIGKKIQSEFSRRLRENCCRESPGGIILCAEKDDVEVEYALRSKKNPIGVAAYKLHAKLPTDMKGKLPTAAQLAAVIRAAIPESSGT